MADNVNYSFLLSKSVCEELDEISQLLRQNALASEYDNLGLLSKAWDSDASELYGKKYLSLLSEQRAIATEIEEESDKIKTLTKHLYLIEEEAKKTAVKKGTN